MAALALTDAFVYVAGHDFTGDSNQLALNMDAAALPVTTFRSGGWDEVVGGLKTQTLDLSGYWQSAVSDSVDSESFSDLATANRVHTIGPTETEGDVAYLFRAGKFHYEPFGGTIGDVAGFTLNSSGTDGYGVVRGQLAKAKGTVSATGALGTGLQLGAVGASEHLYASFHVFSAGTTITVVVESDDNSGFTTATTQATIGPITATGGTWAARVAGAITDTYYRLRVTAITGTFSVAGAIAIGA